MPGWSVYFGWQTLRTTKQWDSIWESVNLWVHQLANGDHAKSMTIRAYLYTYCGDQARVYMKDSNIEWKWVQTYQLYTYLQTQLYQSLQPTVQKLRVIMNDENISFPIILSHLQSNDSELLYYYWTIPERYIDTTFFADIAIIHNWLRRYKTANNTYPISLSDVITYKFVPSSIMLSNKKIVYRAYTVPDIEEFVYITPKRYDIREPSYVLIYQAQYKINIEYKWTLDSLRNKVRTYDYETRLHIKKTPLQSIWKDVWWRVDTNESKIRESYQ
jgi:hypothetical protein